MIEKRCIKCNHLFFKVVNNQLWNKKMGIEIKCPKCKLKYTVSKGGVSIGN